MVLVLDVSISTEATFVSVPQGHEVIHTQTVALWTSAKTTHVVSMQSVSMKDPHTGVSVHKDFKETQLNSVLVCEKQFKVYFALY